jgi:hypothetical protein
MVIVRLWGGLGNQLFQYAAGLGVARKLKTELILDPTQLALDVNRPYELNRLKISGRLWTNTERAWAETMIRILRPINENTRAGAAIIKRLARATAARNFNFVEDAKKGVQSDVFERRGHVYLAGTWANEGYFSAIADTVRDEFIFIQPPDNDNQRMLERIGNCNAISVHVRRGDYISVPEHAQRYGQCSVGYYQAAVDYLRLRMSEPTVFVFSDDPDWAKENLKFAFPTVYVSHNTGNRNHEDLRLMSACRHFVIANSTFSWWGAWLGKANGKIVIAPRRWTIDPTLSNPVPDHWTRL